MIDYIKFLVIASFSFVVAMELLNVLSFTDNLLEGSKETTSFLPDPTHESVVFIGDSYAATTYAEDSYADKFSAFFARKNYHFIDLSRPGTGLTTHIELLDSIKATHTITKPKLVIFFQNVGGILSYDQEKRSSAKENKVTAESGKEQQKKPKGKKGLAANLLERSATAKLAIDILHRVSLLFTDRPFKGTSAASFPKLNLKYKDELREIFNSIEAEHVIILINTRFNFGTRMKKWEHYEVFKDMELNDNIILLQSIDIVPDDDHALSWRNGHPNQEAIDIIADRIMVLADEILSGK